VANDQYDREVSRMINGGHSALAEDFNSNLHEHFKVARQANMKPRLGAEEEPGGVVGGPFESPSEHDGPVHKRTLMHKNGHEAFIEHNRKTGDVKGSAWSNNGSSSMVPEHNDPKKFRESIKNAKSLNYTGDESPEEQIRRAEGPKPDRRIDLYQKDMKRKAEQAKADLREKS